MGETVECEQCTARHAAQRCQPEILFRHQCAYPVGCGAETRFRFARMAHLSPSPELGSIISASLISGLNSDLPGLVIAQVTEPVFDTVSGGILLIPQGSRLIGSYDSVIAFGQSRALVAWQRIIMPNGSSIQIDNLPASDTSGYAGLEDEVDYHTWTLLKGIAVSTLLGVGSQATFGNSNSDLVQAIHESTQESTNQAGQDIVQKDLNVQPTITVRPGWPLRVIVHKDLVLKPYSG